LTPYPSPWRLGDHILRRIEGNLHPMGFDEEQAFV
jgi:hypothetical protein